MKLNPEELFERKLLSKVSKAIEEYGLIEEGDRILIGLSGGKDSLALTELMGNRARIFSPRFSLVAAHIRMANIPYQSDEEYLCTHSGMQDIPFVTRSTSFDLSTDKRKSPCFLCSWYRRKALFDVAKQEGCNKIALGHHQDDILHTLLMNQVFQGSFGTMPPLLSMDKFDMKIIRPMCLITEAELTQYCAQKQYRLQKKNCPYERESYRAEMKEVMNRLEAMNPHVRQSLWNSMTHVQADYLPKKKSCQ